MGIRMRKRKRRIWKRLLMIITLQIVILGVFFWVKENGEENSHLFDAISGHQETKKPVSKKINLDQSRLYSKYVVLMDEDGTVLFEKNAKERMYPASMTKLMTVLVAAEEIDDAYEEIMLDDSIFQETKAQNASVAGFTNGDKVQAIDLMYGVILPSGAECCLGLADSIAGSEQGFCKLMNQKAEQIGMKHTHFCTCTGLHSEEHYSTAYDIAILLKHCMENKKVRNILGSKSYYVKHTSNEPDGITLQSTMYQHFQEYDTSGYTILGGKTGYTGEAGLCLASEARINGKNYILVTAGADGTNKTKQYNIADADTVYHALQKQK